MTGRAIFSLSYLSTRRLVVVLAIVLGASCTLFVSTGYLALFHAWVRGDLAAALPLLPWARTFGVLSVVCAVLAFGILFSSSRFPIPPKLRLALSLIATGTIALFSEFRNEGKFYFANSHHFLAPGEWIHRGLSALAPPLADFLYRLEFSHWNDFLIGPAIVSVIYSVVFFSIYNAYERRNEAMTLRVEAPEDSTGLEVKLRSARIVMYVGLLWFFLQAWGEKAGYLANSHSKDAIDLPFEFAGIVVGFWMARVLTKPFHSPPEKFSSNLLNDLVASGVIGLAYTLIAGPLTESVSRSVAHALYRDVPAYLEVSQYSTLEQHMRPLELLILATVTWWVCNRLVGRAQTEWMDGVEAKSEAPPMPRAAIPAAVVVGAAALHLCLLGGLFWILERQGFDVTLALLGTGVGAGTAVILLVRRMSRGGLASLFSDQTSVAVAPPSPLPTEGFPAASPKSET